MPDDRKADFETATDIHQAQSNLYRRLSANIYKTSVPNQYYHTHGSLDATPILNGLSLPGFLPEPLPSYHEICSIIQAETQKHTPQALDDLTVSLNQSGCIVYKPNDFLATPQGRALATEPLITCTALETTSPPAPFPEPEAPSSSKPTIPPSPSSSPHPHLLSGLKVLDLTRVIAGPSITRTLAEHGCSVIKVTSPYLPDVPYYQLDLNLGKHTVDLDLRRSCPTDRTKFESLLSTVDIVVDGYRTGAMERLGYGPKDLVERFKALGRMKGFVYVRENCFGFSGPMRERSGWQPIADAVSGLAWGHGAALGLDEPVLPPFPMSDYGTGEMGACAALAGLVKRAQEGGSWELGVSLTRWNLWVMGLGAYPEEVWGSLLERHRPWIGKWEVGHLSNFDVVSKAAIEGMRELEIREGYGKGRFFGENGERFMFEVQGEGFGEPGVVKSCRPVVRLSGVGSGWRGTTRPNGWDGAEWW
ncbi:MAG: hypothetical protein Q9160_006280 [Pyrenula sp. 1 TL-2023]